MYGMCTYILDIVNSELLAQEPYSPHLTIDSSWKSLDRHRWFVLVENGNLVRDFLGISIVGKHTTTIPTLLWRVIFYLASAQVQTKLHVCSWIYMENGNILLVSIVIKHEPVVITGKYINQS